MALLLEHGVRADRSSAQKFVAHRGLQASNVVDFQHRIELLRMYDCRLDTVYVDVFCDGFRNKLLPLLAFLDSHKCAPHQSFWHSM